MYSFKFFSIILFTLLAHQGICEGQTMIPANGQCLVNGVLIGICVDGYGCCIDWRGQGFCRTECWATHRWSLHSKGCPYLVHILLLMTTSLAAKMKGLCFNQLLNRCTMLKKKFCSPATVRPPHPRNLLEWVFQLGSWYSTLSNVFFTISVLSIMHMFMFSNFLVLGKIYKDKLGHRIEK